MPVFYQTILTTLLMKCFPDNLKHSEVTQARKKKGKSDISNYKPVTILPIISDIYIKKIFKQLYEYFEDTPIFPSKCSFQMRCNAQH